MNESNARPAKGTLGKVVVIVAIVAAAGLAAAAVVWLAGGVPNGGRFGAAAGRAVDEARSIPAAGAAELTISAVSEEVRVAVGVVDTVEVRLHGTWAGAAAAAAPRLSASRTGSTIAISVERERAVSFNWDSLVLEVTIPPGWAGGIDVGTVSGSVTLPALSADTVAVRTVSGKAVLGAIRAGEASFHTTSGNLRAEALEARRVDLASVSGSLSVQRLSGSARVRSTSGAVSLAFPADAGFRLDARSTSGRVTCAFPISLAAGEAAGRGHALAGTVGDGRDELSVTTVSGSIALKR
jgi:lia operon protein LiaG